MSKETSAFSLIIFLFIILVAWWAVSSFKIPQPATAQQHSSLDTTFLAQKPISIFHASINGVEMYSGAMKIPGCDDLLTDISASSGAQARLRLSFTISKLQETCSTHQNFVSVPFSVTFSSNPIVSKPVLDSVKINNEAAAFAVVEASK